MKEPAVGSYRVADGARHELVVRQTTDGGWRVLDLNLDAGTAHVVDTLPDEQDGRPQAEAVARDYLSVVADSAASAGRTPRNPIPEPGGTDARTHRRPRPGSRTPSTLGNALPRAAR
jgi:hypothetical protein